MKNKSYLEPEYDFSKGIRGKYAKRFASGTNLVALDPDVSKKFQYTKAGKIKIAF